MTEEVPEREARAFDTLQGTTIFITQRDGSFYAYQNLCPHLQILSKSSNWNNFDLQHKNLWLKRN